MTNTQLCSGNRKRNRFANTERFSICCWAVQNWSVFVKSLFLMLDGSIERKSSSENRNVIWKTHSHISHARFYQTLRSLLGKCHLLDRFCRDKRRLDQVVQPKIERNCSKVTSYSSGAHTFSAGELLTKWTSQIGLLSTKMQNIYPGFF